MCIVLCLPKILCDLKQLISCSKSVAESQPVILGTTVISEVKFSPFPENDSFFIFRGWDHPATSYQTMSTLKTVSCVLCMSPFPGPWLCSALETFPILMTSAACYSTIMTLCTFPFKNSGRGVTWRITEYSGLDREAATGTWCKMLLKLLLG